MPGATLITGVSSGIGLETAIYLAQKGLNVVGTLRDLAKRSVVDQAARSAGVSVDLVALDVTDPATIAAAVTEITQRHGSIEALVNNAGTLLRGYFEDLSDEEMRRVFEANVFGAMAVTRAVIPQMRSAHRGRIVFLSSVAGLVGSPGMSAYCASKFAIEGFASSLALELALYGVYVSLVEPGNVNTEIWKNKTGVAQGAQDVNGPNRRYFVETERLAEWAVNSSPIRSTHVAKAIGHALTSGRPKRRYLIGSRPAGFLFARRVLPDEMFERVYTNAVVGKLKKSAASATR